MTIRDSDSQYDRQRERGDPWREGGRRERGSKGGGKGEEWIQKRYSEGREEAKKREKKKKSEERAAIEEKLM